MPKIAVTWAKDGNIHWEDWWIKRHGAVRTRLPGEKEHVSFANFDLQKNGLPRLATLEDGDYAIDVLPEEYFNAKFLLEYHGFVVAPLPT